jgi:hypothetical protein
MYLKTCASSWLLSKVLSFLFCCTSQEKVKRSMDSMQQKIFVMKLNRKYFKLCHGIRASSIRILGVFF